MGIGEGNGSPLQYSCLVNPRDGGAWWAAIYGVTQIRTRLKRLSSSSLKRYLGPSPSTDRRDIYQLINNPAAASPREQMAAGPPLT